jgi:hypothetical protein
MPDQPSQWGPHDAWILLAVALCDRESGGTLRDVIAEADDADHAVPSFDDLAGALEHLTQAGFVDAADHLYRLTADGARICDSVTAALPANREKMAALRQYLETHPPVAAAEPARITDGDYEYAAAEYLGAFG